MLDTESFEQEGWLVAEKRNWDTDAGNRVKERYEGGGV
jgi:hypothetical protein